MTDQLFEQAIFTSACSNSVKGYHLVARSSGISDEISQALCLWSPTHDGLSDSRIDASSINFFRIDNVHFALSRSVYGGPEYSGRGALQIATTILVGHLKQLENYQSNPATMARIAISMGWLRFRPEIPHELDPICLPAYTLPELPVPAVDESRKRIVESIRSGRRIAIIGRADPHLFVESLLRLLTPAMRTGTSFSTGMKPSGVRPFDIHCFSELDNRLRAFLNKQEVLIINHDLALQMA